MSLNILQQKPETVPTVGVWARSEWKFLKRPEWENSKDKWERLAMVIKETVSQVEISFLNTS